MAHWCVWRISAHLILRCLSTSTKKEANRVLKVFWWNDHLYSNSEYGHWWSLCVHENVQWLTEWIVKRELEMHLCQLLKTPYGMAIQDIKGGNMIVQPIPVFLRSQIQKLCWTAPWKRQTFQCKDKIKCKIHLHRMCLSAARSALVLHSEVSAPLCFGQNQGSLQ